MKNENDTKDRKNVKGTRRRCIKTTLRVGTYH